VFFPQFVQGGGIASELIITNPGDASQNGTINFFDDSGQPLGVQIGGETVSSWSFSLPPGGLARLKTGANGPVKAGYAEIPFPESEPTVNSALIYNLAGQVSVAGSQPSNACHLYVERTSSYNSGIAVVNPGSQALDVDLLLVDQNGIPRAERKLTLAPKAHLAQFVDEMFPGLDSEFFGTLNAVSTAGFSVVGLRQNRADGSLAVLAGGRGAFGTERRWLQATEHADFSPRLGHEMITFHGKAWVIGGKVGPQPPDNGKDVWCSDDAIHWSLATDSPAFPKRAYPEATVFSDKLWSVGGRWEPGVELADAWYSADGLTWQAATETAEFGPRWLHCLVAFQGRLWVIAGSRTAGAGSGFFDDVWSSADGAHWQRETAHAGFSPRSAAQAVVFKDKIWVIGGGQGQSTGNLSDVWSSADGVNWTLVTADAGFAGRHGLRAVVWDDAIWVTAGVTNGGYGNEFFMNDLWKSTDGEHWTAVQTTARYPGRMAPDLLLFGNRLWLTGGTRFNAQGSFDSLNDVWYLF